MKRYFNVIIVTVAILCNWFVYAQGEENLPSSELERKQKADKAKYEQIKKISKDSDSAIEFYGVVKDQYGTPVPDAKVEASFEHFDLLSPFFIKNSRVSATTDPQGYFEFNGLKGRLLSIDTMEKQGYAYDFRKNEHRYFGYNPKGLNPFMPDEQNPVVFIFHKKPESAYVIENSISYQGRPEGSKFQIDVYKGFTQSSQTITNAWGDMRVEIQPAGNVGEYIVKIKLNNQDDWLLAEDPDYSHVAPDQDRWLMPEDPAADHAAPQDGYAKSVEFTIKKNEDLKKDVYFKGQKETGFVYSRLHLKLSAGTSVHVDGTLYTNLDGGKNLNYDRKFTLNRKIQDVSVKIDKEPKNAKLYKERAELKRELSLYDDAIADINKALIITPEDKGLQRLKERTQTNKKRHAELKAQGFKFSD